MGNCRVQPLVCVLAVLVTASRECRPAEAGNVSPGRTGNVIEVPLIHESGPAFSRTVQVRFADRPVTFATEPTSFSKNAIFRSALTFGTGTNVTVPCAWDRTTSTLYLDNNRNGDLTDDPRSIFKGGGSSAFGSFTNVLVVLPKTAGGQECVLDLTMFWQGAYHYAYANVRSYWQGRLSLEGRDWQVGIVQDLAAREMPLRPMYLLLRPWESRTGKRDLEGATPWLVDYSDRYFLEGHAFDVECQWKRTNGAASALLVFRERDAVCGELEVRGSHLNRLVLSSPGGLVAILDGSAGKRRLPVGAYATREVWLKSSAGEAYCTTPTSVVVSAKTPGLLEVGGPVTNHVTVDRSGQKMTLSYELRGKEGKYHLRTRGDKPPDFKIVQGTNAIHSGHFEFG